MEGSREKREVNAERSLRVLQSVNEVEKEGKEEKSADRATKDKSRGKVGSDWARKINMGSC